MADSELKLSAILRRAAVELLKISARFEEKADRERKSIALLSDVAAEAAATESGRLRELAILCENAIPILRPIKDVPRTAEWVLGLSRDKHGNLSWLPVHWACGGGEDQPPFRGIFARGGGGFYQISEESLLGFILVPQPDEFRFEAQQICPGHVGMKDYPRVCARCGVHIDELRPIPSEEVQNG